MPDEKKCIDWIRAYMKPYHHVNHMYTSFGLWKMMAEDTRSATTHDRFKELMLEEGFEPADKTTSDWEFRISPAPLRMRPKAKARVYAATKLATATNYR